jgi:pilus assembly protein CpaB
VSIRTVLIVGLALVFGLSAAVGVAQMSRRPAAAAEETVPVLVAVVDIPRFTTVTAEMLKTRDFPKAMVPAGSITKLEDAVDRVTDISILKDEPVLDGKLSRKGTGRGMAAVIPPGMRAVTIKTPSVSSGVGGFVLPGNRVDVVFTMKTHQPNDGTGGSTATTLIQAVEILAVDQQIEAPSDNKVKEMKSVTLLVTPDQAAQIELAQNNGELALVLRNPQDTRPAQAAVATLRDIQYRQNRPLDERIQSVLDAASKAWAEMQEAALKAERERLARAEKEKKDAPPAPPPAPPRVRTLRGGIPGHVDLY